MAALSGGRIWALRIPKVQFGQQTLEDPEKPWILFASGNIFYLLKPAIAEVLTSLYILLSYLQLSQIMCLRQQLLRITQLYQSCLTGLVESI